MSEFYDERETQEPDEREADLLSRLPQVLQAAAKGAPAIARQLDSVDLAAVRSREDLLAIPVFRKSELLKAQLEARERARSGAPSAEYAQSVFGGFSSISWGAARKVFASPGPMYEPESRRPDYWGFARALYAAGFRREELIFNCFSYHFTPAGSMMETAAHALDCTVFPGGWGKPNNKCRPWPTCARMGTPVPPAF